MKNCVFDSSTKSVWCANRCSACMHALALKIYLLYSYKYYNRFISAELFSRKNMRRPIFFRTYTLGSLNTCKCQMCFQDVFFKIIDFSYRMRLTAKTFLKNPYFECTDAIDVLKIKWALLGQVYLSFVTYTKAVPLIKKNLRWFLDYSSIFEQSSFFLLFSSMQWWCFSNQPLHNEPKFVPKEAI